MLVLLGPSGCGKTTLLRMIGGLIKPSEGRIEVAGLPLWTSNGRNQEAVRKLGIVFQDPNLFPWLTVEDNVALPLEIQGVPRSGDTYILHKIVHDWDDERARCILMNCSAASK